MNSLGNSSDLTWSYPGGPGDGNGMVWYGTIPATPEDVQEIRDHTSDPHNPLDRPCKIDPEAVCGRWDATWNSNGYSSVGKRNSDGGLGSSTYENQKVNSLNVSFTKTEIYYCDLDSNFVTGIPPQAGAYYKKAGESTQHEGPEPDSPAYIERGAGVYAWDDENEYYIIIPA
jgi:hypothetical protein